MKRNTVEEIENISLSAKQIKNKLEDSLSYDHSKFKNTKILFATKSEQEKLPFSSYKVAISEELSNQQLLLETLQTYIEETKMLEEQPEEQEFILEEVFIDEENDDEEEEELSIIEEVCEFDEIEDDEFDEDEHPTLPTTQRVKRPKGYTIKVVDVEAVIRKIKQEGEEKNKGKPVIGRRQINKLLKPYMLKNDTHFDIEGIDNSLTSIDIYLNAVDKIASTEPKIEENDDNFISELTLDDILRDLK